MTFTPTTWAEQLLEDVNKEAPNETPVPIDANTVGDILHWMPAEEPTSDWYDRNNPLNASAGTSASDGTGSYPDLATGAWYTAGMIDQGNMAMIRSALSADNSVSGFSPAVVASPWASSHYGGDPQHIAETAIGGGSAPAGTGTPGAVPDLSLASPSSSATLTGAYGVPGLPGFLDPTNDLASFAQDLWVDIFAKGLLIVGGLSLVVLGLYKSTQGPRKKIAGGLAQGGEIAGLAAA